MRDRRYFYKLVLSICCALIFVVGLEGKTVYAIEDGEILHKVGILYADSVENVEVCYYNAAPAYEWEDEVLSRLRDAVEAGETRVELADLNIPGEQCDAVELVIYYSIEYEFFFSASAITASDGSIEYVSIGYRGAYLDEEGNVDLSALKYTYEKARRNFDNIMLAVDDNMSDVEKVLYVHDWLVEQVDYAYEEYLEDEIPDVCYTALGPLFEHKSVCQGYAEAFSLLLKHMGINNCIVTSWKMNHAWNMVELDGEWYHVDATWDDPVYSDLGGDYWKEGSVRHVYFLKSDEEFLQLEHYAWEEEDGAPIASVSGAFVDDIFYGSTSTFCYKDGKWCYFDYNKIVQCDYDREDVQEYTHDYRIINGVLVDDTYFFADYKKLYSIPFDGVSDGVITEVYEAKGQINEFAVKDGTAIVVYWDSEAEGWVTERFSLVDYLNIDSFEAHYRLNEVNVGEAIDVDEIAITAYTANGYQFAIPVEECSVSEIDTATPGVKQLTVECMGTELQISIPVVYSLTGEYELEVATYEYTGAPIEPVPVVYHDGVKLKQGQDYSVSYSDNCMAGTAKITVEGQGDYRGTFSIPFEITKKIISEDDIEVILSESGLADDSTLWSYIQENILVRVGGVTFSDEDYYYLGANYSEDWNGNISISVRLYFENYRGAEGEAIDCEVRLVPLGWEDTKAFVDRLYTTVLGRTPDAGSETWVELLLDGSYTGAQVAEGFIMSTEFLGKDIRNEEFVKIMYRAFFNREADAGGLATWKGSLDEGYMKKFVFAGFANSDEFKALCDTYGIECGVINLTLAERTPNLSEQDFNIWQFVERLYSEVMGRNPDQTGMDTWVGVLKAGTYTGAQVAEGFILSDEFLNKDMTNEEFVKIMYRAFFNRDADAAGFETWTNALETGWTKEAVFAGFANSAEFGRICDEYGIIQGSVATE